MSETLPEYGGCLWPADPACLGDKWDDLAPEVQVRALALASSTLQRLTAYRVGGCPVTVRPCVRRGCWEFFQPNSTMLNPVIVGGRWLNSVPGACSITDGITLPGPVGYVEEVKVDGLVLFAADYRIVDGTTLVWMGEGEAPWNFTQDLSLPDSMEGTFSVTYLNAYPVDMLGAQAAAFLAMEFAAACKPKGKCALPRGVTNVVRGGVTFEIESSLFPDGKTGIDVVDAFIDMWNPHHRTQPSTVWTPDNQMRR